MNIHERISNFDFDNAQPYDLAVLLEQVFLYHNDRSKDGGPIIVAQGILRLYEASVRKRSAPELHSKTISHLRELRSDLGQMEQRLRVFEKDASSSR